MSRRHKDDRPVQTLTMKVQSQCSDQDLHCRVIDGEFAGAASYGSHTVHTRSVSRTESYPNTPRRLQTRRSQRKPHLPSRGSPRTSRLHHRRGGLYRPKTATEDCFNRSKSSLSRTKLPPPPLNSSWRYDHIFTVHSMNISLLILHQISTQQT